MKTLTIYKIPKKRNIIFLIIMIGLDYVFSRLSFTISNKFYPNFVDDNTVITLSPQLLFITSILIAPILETIVIQFLLIEGLLKLKVKEVGALILSTIVFALLHYYNIGYVISILLSSWIYSYYYLSLRNQSVYTRISLVALVHATGNLIAYYA